MPTISPSPFPTNGARTLSPKESLQRLQALSCVAPKDTQPSCSGQVFVGMFFDGTGNNLHNDYEVPPPDKRKHSNVVKLFQTYKFKPEQGYLSYYIPGVGTPFPEIGEKEENPWGSRSGSGGEQRICWGLLQVINAVHRYVHKGPLLDEGRAKTISGNMSGSTTPAALRRTALQAWQDKLQAALKDQKPRVEQINLSVFGFSRGAAQARVFVNWLFEVCKQEGGAWTFAGIPIRLQFLGVFDTVASVGLANLGDEGTLAGHQSWADNTLQIHPAVEQCVHFVAGHEVRACFPLDSVRVKNTYPGNAKEVMYPGAHSDVGGGYAPGALGIDFRPNSSMSVIAGANMYKEALLAGVPLIPMAKLAPEFREALTPSGTTIVDFNAYLRDANIGGGTIEAMHRKHMGHYHSYRYKCRGDMANTMPWKAALPEKNRDSKGKPVTSDREALHMTQQDFLKSLCLKMADPNSPNWDAKAIAEQHQAMGKASGIKSSYAERVTYEVAGRINTPALTPAIEKFCGEYVHDSVAGFIVFGMHEYKLNNLGLAKYRGIFNGND